MKKPRYILWCDFETTGLCIETLAPIEVAFELTDTNFDEKVALRLHVRGKLGVQERIDGSYWYRP